MSKDGYAFDIVDFPNRRIDRWYAPLLRNQDWPKQIKDVMYPKRFPLGYDDPEKYCLDHYLTPHTVHLCPQGKLFATFGVSESGFGIVTVDTNTGETGFIGSNETPSKLFVSTGDFDTGYTRFLFAKWPMSNSPRDREKTVPNSIEINSLDIDTYEEKHLYTATEELVDGRPVGIGLPRSLHQSTMSEDGRYIVCAPYDGVQEVPVNEDELNGKALDDAKPIYNHRMVLEYIVTIDLETSKHWLTKIPVPVPAHIEFDLDDPHVFYASAHNIAGLSVGTVLEGTATLFKLKITDGDTKIVGSYTDERLYRITQHSLYNFEGTNFIVLTCVPNRLVIIYADTMELFRDVELFRTEPIIMEDGRTISPESQFSVYSVNPSSDGRYVVLENASDFIAYDMKEDRVLDVRLNRAIPAGYGGRGHTRTAGQ